MIRIPVDLLMYIYWSLMHALNPKYWNTKANSFYHNQSTCFKPYSAFKSLYTHLNISFKISSLISQSGSISIQMFISAVEFKKALTISICLIFRSNKATNAIASFYMTFLHTPANVWSQSFLYYYLNPLTTYLAFYFKILLFLSLLVFKTSFFSSTLIPFNSFNHLKSFQVPLQVKPQYSFLITFFHSGQLGLNFASLIVLRSL